jgi:hypothetical protein
MDITNQVDSIVENLVKQIETRLNARVDNLVTAALTQRLDNIDYEKKLNWLASTKLDGLIAGMEVDHTRVQERLDAVADQVVNSFEAETKRLATEHVKHKLYNEIDVNHTVREIVLTEISKKLATFAFPNASIPGDAINSRTLIVSGNNIRGGTIQNFNSNGIEDKSTQVQMTLLDAGVVIENKIISLGLEVKGQTVIEGDLHIKGDVPMTGTFAQRIIENTVAATKQSLNTELFDGFSSTLFERIQEHGIDLNKLTLNGNPVIDGSKLSYSVTDTNITRLGLVRDLQTTGEALLSQTLYVGDKRVGINTLEPGHALSVWDQEVEIGFGKRERDVAWVGTPRDQTVVLSANRKDNLVLNKDGTVSINELYIGQQQIGFSAGTPAHGATKGSVLFNSAPGPGQPAGWISLGNGAWSRFGTLS